MTAKKISLFLRFMIRSAAILSGGILFGICYISGLAFLMGSQVYYEVSDSMRPVIRRGDLLLVSSREDYKPGDIIVFHTDYNGEASCVTHRIVRKTLYGYRTRGDANKKEDVKPVTRTMIAGKVVGVIPFYGFICRQIQRHRMGTVWYAAFLTACLYVRKTDLGKKEK